MKRSSIHSTPFNCLFEMMDPNLDDHNLSKNNVNIESPMRVTKTGGKSNKCNQCDFASPHGSSLRRHLKKHSGEKSNKCNQCDYASSHTANLRGHLKTHSGEKNK